MTLSDLVRGWPFAVVWMRNKQAGTEQVRAAAFTFDARGGFAWVEPSYLDPWSQQGFRRVRCALGEVVPGADEVTFEGAEWAGRIERFDASPEQLKGGEGLLHVVEALREKGRTLDQEREQLRAHLADDLA
jgi:hypothetical protein